MDMWIDEEGLIDIVSNHNMMVLNCISQGQREEGRNRNKDYRSNMRGGE